MSIASASLQHRFSQALPSVSLLIHHIASESCPSPAIFSAPPSESAEPTTSESHFLSASIEHHGKPLQVFALEVYVYMTASLNTIFVSKADSTGYLHLLKIPKGTPSPIKTVITTFLEWLVEVKRSNTRLLLSLFARAQNQYLFPGSIENSGKHVLDDRGLIRWWCRVLDPILSIYGEETKDKAHGHVVIPGLDAYETRSYFPRGPTLQQKHWSVNDPLQSLGKPAGLPTRCYIPRFPDDPKARFLIDLDDELPEEPASDSNLGISPGIWRSVKSLPQFWELMSFRQECGAGRLVGFIWCVFEPASLVDKPLQAARIEQQAEEVEKPVLLTPGDSQHQSQAEIAPTLLSSPMLKPLNDGLPSPLPSSQPQAVEETHGKPEPPANALTQPGEGILQAQRTETGVQLTDTAYKNALLLLDTLDYANEEIALESTEKFLIAVSPGIEGDWVMKVVGERNPISLGKVASISSSEAPIHTVNVISTGMVRSKKRALEEASPQKAVNQEPEVKVLSASLVRKKPKT